MGSWLLSRYISDKEFVHPLSCITYRKSPNNGQISPGFIADIVATNDDPTDNVSTLENVIFVMKNGIVYKN